MVKVRVHVDGRAIGWLRAVAVGEKLEVLVAPALARATKFDETNAGDRQAMALYMSEFIGPERASGKAREPVVTFQLVRV